MADVKPGAHINAVGACTPNARELGSELIINSSIITDNLESLLNESGDYLIPLNNGEIKKDHVTGVLSDVVSGIIKGRETEEDITVYESLGIGVEDLVVANYLYNTALQNNTGQRANI